MVTARHARAVKKVGRRSLPTSFDPLHVWLGIAPEEQPADHYRLLGLRRFEDNDDVIQSATDRQVAHIRQFQRGTHASEAAKLLNRISQARTCLLTPGQKAQYDRQLRLSTGGSRPLKEVPLPKPKQVPQNRQERSLPRPPRLEQKESVEVEREPMVQGESPSYERIRRRSSPMERVLPLISTRIGLAILAGSVAMVVLSAGIAALSALLILRSTDGILVVSTDDDVTQKVEVQVLRDGELIRVLSADSNWRLELESGTYELAVVADSGDFRLDRYRVRIEHNREESVVLSRKPESPKLPLAAPTKDTEEQLRETETSARRGRSPIVTQLAAVTGEDTGLDHVDNRQSLTGLAYDGNEVWGLIYLGPEKFVVLDNETKKWRDTDQEKPRIAIARAAGSFSSPGGACLADGNLWVCGAYGDSIACIDTKTWEVVRRFPGKRRDLDTGQGYPGITHDGKHLWVIWTFGNYDPKVKTRFLLKLDPQTGEELAEYPLPEGLRADGTHGLTCDGESLWYIQQQMLSRIDPTNGRVRAQYKLKDVSRPSGMTWVGDALLIAEFSGKLWRLPFDDGPATSGARGRGRSNHLAEGIEPILTDLPAISGEELSAPFCAEYMPETQVKIVDFGASPRVQRYYGNTDAGRVLDEQLFRFEYSSAIGVRGVPHCGYRVDTAPAKVDIDSVLVFRYRARNLSDLRLNLKLSNQSLGAFLTLAPSEEWREMRIPLSEKYSAPLEDATSRSISFTTFAQRSPRGTFEEGYLELEGFALERLDNPSPAKLASLRKALAERLENQAKLDGFVRAAKLSTDKPHYLVGEPVIVTYSIVNTSPHDIAIPWNHQYSRPMRLLGTEQKWIESVATKKQQAAGGTIVPYSADVLLAHAEVERKHTLTQKLAPGRYRVLVEWKSTVGKQLNVEFAEFEVIPSDELP